MKFHLTRVSGNSKTGPMPVSISERDTCPRTCAFLNNGCYAETGPLRIHWDKVPERGLTADAFLAEIRRLPGNMLWRHNQAGDLPHTDGRIDTKFLNGLVSANVGKKGFTFTHHTLTLENTAAIRSANERGFTVNVSANNPEQAVRLFKASGLPVVTVMSMDAPNVQVVDGVKIIACPAEKSDKVACINCGICQKSYAARHYIVGFRAHGTGKKKAELVAKGEVHHG